MSCSQNKTDAVAAWGSYSAGSVPIKISEETTSTNNQVTIAATKGTVTCNLTFANGLFPTTVNGTAKLYLKISKQADGFSDTGINTPPVFAHDPATYENDALQTPTLNTSFTSTTYASATPAFSPSNACGTDETLGWQMSDAQVVMTRTPIKQAYVKFS